MSLTPEVKDKIIVITGASDGIGAEAARQLHQKGATVVLVGRSPNKTKAVARELGAAYYTADFTRLDDVRKLAANLRKDYIKIDVLANNAGGIFNARETTIDGHEKTMQVNHLAPFLLTTLLMDLLITSHATIINTSSVAHKTYSAFDINDLENEKKYTSRRAYGNAKLENILFTRELSRRYHNKGVSAAAFHPGKVATNFANATNDWLHFIFQTPLRHLFLISPAEGADTLVWLASTLPGKDWQSGEYYYKRKISPTVALAARSDDYAKRLWEQSEKLSTTKLGQKGH